MKKISLMAYLIFVIVSCSPSSFFKVPDEVIKNFKPKDLKNAGKILLVKVNYEKNPYRTQLPQFMSENYSGKFILVPGSISIDKNYADTSIYKYVLVIGGAITDKDFQGISNKEVFFDKSDGSFLRTGSSLYIYDRSSNHELYETGDNGITYNQQKGYNGFYTSYEVISYVKLKKYLEILNQ